MHALSELENPKYLIAARLYVAQPNTTFEMARGTWTMAKETLRRAGSLRSRSALMRNLFILAVAASFAVACGASRTEDEVGAAPERGDTTAVAADTAVTTPTDSTMGQVETDTGFVQQDTTLADPGMNADTTMAEPGYGVDSVGAQGEVQTPDTADTGAWTDTTGAETTDTTVQQ